MDISAPAVKQQRTQRAWTQQHLADACGVSLRTIQRVERYGTASNETLMSLAAVFEIEHKSLIVEAPPEIVAPPGPATYGRLISLLVFSGALGATVGGLGVYLLMS